jgi:sulfate transporter 4
MSDNGDRAGGENNRGEGYGSGSTGSASETTSDDGLMRRRLTIHRQSLLKMHNDISTGRSSHVVPDPEKLQQQRYSEVEPSENNQGDGSPEGWVDKHKQNIRDTLKQRSCSDWVGTFLPLYRWLQKYNYKDYLLTDVLAGVTVGVMIVPQSMSYAKLAGLPVEYGLYSSLVPIYAYALFGSSRQLAVGPVALVSLMLNTGLTQVLQKEGMTPENTPDYNSIYATIALQTSFLAGVCFIVMGLLRMGFVTIFLSHAVVSGFTSAAAIIIGLSQIKYIFGYDIPSDKSLHQMLPNIFASIDEFNYKTFLLGTSCVFVLMGLKKLAQKYPKFKWTKAIGPLLVTVVGIILQASIDLEERGIPIVGPIPKGFPTFTADVVFPLKDIGNLSIVIVSIVLVGFMESIAIAKQLSNKHNYELDSSLELVGLGMANMTSGLFGGYPVVGSFSRSAVNSDAGAQSGISAIVTATLVGLTLLFLTPVFELLVRNARKDAIIRLSCFDCMRRRHLTPSMSPALPTQPLAVLASIVISGVLSLVDYPEAIYLWKVHKFDFCVWMFAFLGTLFLGVELGLGIAVAISLLLVIFESAYPHTSVLGRLPGTHQYRNIKQYPRAERYDGIVMVRIDAPIYFANCQNVREKIEKYYERAQEELALREQEHPTSTNQVKYVILEMGPVSHVDTSALHFLADMNTNYKNTRHIQLCLANPNRSVMHRLVLSGLADDIGREHIFVSLHDAAKYCLHEMDDREMSIRGEHAHHPTEIEELMRDVEPSLSNKKKLPYVASENTIRDFSDERVNIDAEKGTSASFDDGEAPAMEDI